MVRIGLATPRASLSLTGHAVARPAATDADGPTHNDQKGA